VLSTLFTRVGEFVSGRSLVSGVLPALAITDQLAAGLGLGGRDRTVASASERARSAVTQGIRSALRRIDQEVPALATRLRSCVKTGTFCVYRPDPERPLRWSW
jgi:transposase